MTTLKRILKGTGSVAILGHVRPGRDCLSSTLGLYNYLRLNCPDIRAAVYLEEASDKFGYLKGFDEIRHRAGGENYELCVCLDCGDVGRLGESSSLLAQAKKSLCLGHHMTSTHFADSNLVVPEASSACEILYGRLGKGKIDIRMAECLYTGIVHDTGVFKYSCTSGATMEIARKLVAKGIDFGSIIDNSFYKKTYIQNQILGRALLESITFLDRKCIFDTIRQNEMGFYGVDNKDMDEIIGQLHFTDGVGVAIFLCRTGAQEYKVSTCSQSLVDVSRTATFFGGGGHVRVTGYTMTESIHGVINNPFGHTAEQLEPGVADRA